MTTGPQTCLRCRGVFFDPQPDGSRYYHVCPPDTTSVTPTTGVTIGPRGWWQRLRGSGRGSEEE